jgi:hypothetical protein
MLKSVCIRNSFTDLHWLMYSVGSLHDILCSKSLPGLQILLSKLIFICLSAPVQWCPLGLILEQAHSFCVLQTNISITVATRRIWLRDQLCPKHPRIRV